MKPMIIDDGLIPAWMLSNAADDFVRLPADKLVYYDDEDFGVGKRTLSDLTVMPHALHSLLNSMNRPEFLQEISQMTGVKDLLPDHTLWGGGAHMTVVGGYLPMHRDFNVVPTSYSDPVPLRRALNLIVYLTPTWEPSWGGELQIQAENGDDLNVAPQFGRAVLFDPSQIYHGHPYPYRGLVPRQSVAVYYYVREPVPMDQWRSTQYLALPWLTDTPERAARRDERGNARLRYAKHWPQGLDGNGSPA